MSSMKRHGPRGRCWREVRVAGRSRGAAHLRGGHRRASRRVAVGALVLVVALATSGCQLARTMVDVGAADPGERVVALTFDDGPDPANTPQLLDVLRRHGVHATFFVLGSQAEQHPGLLDRIVREGHGVANHTWNHKRLTTVSDAVVAAEVGWTHGWLAGRGIQSRCVRPPYGATDARVDRLIRRHAESSYTMLWSVDSRDWERPPVNQIVNNVMSRVHPGAVILFHDGGGDRSRTVAAVDQLIPRLRAAGYDIAPICK